MNQPLTLWRIPGRGCGTFPFAQLLAVFLAILDLRCAVGGGIMILRKSVVFPAAVVADVVIIQRFMTANGAEDDGVVLVIGASYPWQIAPAKLAANGGTDAFAHHDALKIRTWRRCRRSIRPLDRFLAPKHRNPRAARRSSRPFGPTAE